MKNQRSEVLRLARDGEEAVRILEGRKATCMPGCFRGQHVELCDNYLARDGYTRTRTHLGDV